MAVRTVGDGKPVVLLHGMMSSGDSFGAGFDGLAADHRIVAPDLLGFGRSMQDGGHFGLEAHLDALDAMAAAVGLGHDGWVVGGHSMGGVLALHWAGRHAPRVRRVVTWGAPLYASRQAALAAIGNMGWLERLFALDTPLARAACAWSCRHRDLAGWLAAAANPDLPVPLARHSSRHTWPAYRDALEGVILAADWRPSLDTLADRGVTVVLARGADDPVSDPTVLGGLARRYRTVETPTHPASGHELPLADPRWCVAQLTAH